MLSRLLRFLQSKSNKKNIKDDGLLPSPSTHKHRTSSVTTATMTTIQSEGTAPTDTAPAWYPGTKKRTLILDLGDVLFHYAVGEIKALSPSNFKAVITTQGWEEFECGRVNEDEALASIIKELPLDIDIIREALTQCRRLLHVDHDLYGQLKALKTEMNGNLRVYAMTNISRDDFGRLKNILPSWDLFDAEFTSFETGMIKPDPRYYKHVLDEISLADPRDAIFVDDKIVNVNAARAFGIHGIVFESPTALMDQLRARLLTPYVASKERLDRSCSTHSLSIYQ
jgi:FMN phosphatase YigB (HAD superfamily)